MHYKMLLERQCERCFPPGPPFSQIFPDMSPLSFTLKLFKSLVLFQIHFKIHGFPIFFYSDHSEDLFFDAARKGDVAYLKQLIESHIDINTHKQLLFVLTGRTITLFTNQQKDRNSKIR